MLEMSSKIENKVIGKQILTLGTCIKILLKNGKKIGFTTHTRNVKFLEEPELIYYSKGFTPTVISKNNEMSVDNADGQIIIDNDVVNEDDLENGIYNNAEFFLFDFDWTLKTNGFYSMEDIIRDVSGTVGEVKREKLKYTTEYRSLAQYLAITIIDTYKVSCPVALGDPIRCKVDLTGFTLDDSIGAVISKSQFILNDSIKPTGEYNNGNIEFITGQNKGKRYKVKSWDLSTKILTLQLPVNYPVADNDQVKLISGCNKLTDCKEKFNNYVNFQGFPHIPGIDFITTGGGTKINY